MNNTETLRETIFSDKAVRRAVVRKSHHWFFSIFLNHYVEHEVALFHREMFNLTEDTEHKLFVIMAFRGSGKSTIMNLSYALWAILDVQQKRFILIVSNTQSQAKTHFLNIRDELRYNTLLSKDLGPFETDDMTWGLNSIVLPKMGARITVASREQAVRGIRFWQHRPDLIICDDLEDSSSVQSKSDRDSTYEWFMSEVMPAGDMKTKIVVLGNLLGEDSLLMRLRHDIQQRKMNGVFKAYPLLDDTGRILWPGKYDAAKIDQLRLSVPDQNIWDMEYQLKYQPEKWLIELGRQRDRMKWDREQRQWIDPGDPNAPPHPPQVLGEYVISAPVMTFGNFLSSMARQNGVDPSEIEYDWNGNAVLNAP